MSGFRTLFYKEILRFWKVAFQTVLAPVITALLYLMIFGHALRGHVAGLSGRRVHELPDSRPRDDERVAERICE